MAKLLKRYDDFSGGHWGAAGARSAKEEMFGGKNVQVTRDRRLAPASASRALTFTNLAVGEIKSIHWAWGVDGRIYFLQDVIGAATYQVRRFTVDLDSPITITNVGAPIPAPSRAPDWTDFGELIYLTVYSEKTYVIDPTAVTITALTSAAGDAPGGRALVAHGERLMIGGIDDARMGTQGNRVCYSEPGAVGNFPSDNFFDVGAGNIEIGGLYALNDTLTIILSDQQIWTFRGVPGGVSNLRRQYGFHAGSGGTSGFQPSDGTVDPSQVRLWLYDHSTRGLGRFSGTQFARVPDFGVPTANREEVTDINGGVAAIGGPDEVFVDQVPMPQTDGNSAAGDNLELVRLNGAFSVVERAVLAGTTEET